MQKIAQPCPVCDSHSHGLLYEPWIEETDPASSMEQLLVLLGHFERVFRHRDDLTRLIYSGPRNLDSVISYTWEPKRGGPSGTYAQEVSAFL